MIVGGDSAAVAELDLRRFDFQFGGVADDLVGCLKDLHIDYNRAEERGSGKVGLKFELVTVGYDMSPEVGDRAGSWGPLYRLNSEVLPTRTSLYEE